MQIKHKNPPNIEQLQEFFDLEDREIAFTYNDVLYIPSGFTPSSDLMNHEEIHQGQQKDIGGAQIWYDKYVHDTEFRLSQELEAYRSQYRYFTNLVKDRNEQARFLRAISLDLSSVMYGSMVSFSEAMKGVKDK